MPSIPYVLVTGSASQAVADRGIDANVVTATLKRGQSHYEAHIIIDIYLCLMGLEEENNLNSYFNESN